MKHLVAWLLLAHIPFITMAASTRHPWMRERGGPKMLEEELTEALQMALGPLDPATIPLIQTHFARGNTSVVMSAPNSVVSGFSSVIAISFTPPIPLISKHVSVSLSLFNMTVESHNYTITGTHLSNAVNGSGLASFLLEDMVLKATFKADRYSLNPMEMCVMKDSLSYEMVLAAVECYMEGASDVGRFVEQNPSLITEAIMSTSSPIKVEDMLNKLMCFSDEKGGQEEGGKEAGGQEEGGKETRGHADFRMRGMDGGSENEDVGRVGKQSKARINT